MSPKFPCLPVLAAILAAGACTAPVAAVLDAGPEAVLARVVPARGVQIYECRDRKDAQATEWVFVAPDAELLDTRGHVVGKHGAGPYWQSNDGSRITAKVKARADAPVAGAIPWLLLEATDAGIPGAFSGVTHIQRVETQGGIAPATACVRGEQARVPYTAEYRFFSNPTKR
jgi:hypothetical protein